MLNIYLVDLANDFIEVDNKSIPIGIGYVGAYCKHRFKNNINLYIFRTLKPFLEKIRQVPPDIVGFGCYDWNYNLSRKAAAFIKQEYPKCMTVFGGANTDSNPENNRTFLMDNPQVDFLVYGDGEFPFSNLVDLLFRYREEADHITKIKPEKIDGVRSLNKETLVMGSPVDTVMDLNQLPSPYITGLFDNLLQDGLLMPIIQNVRGCPYQCSFCVSGNQTSAVRRFPVERVIGEIDYLRNKAKHQVLRFSDDNFGIMKEDVSVAHYLKESHEAYNYPAGIKVYLSKRLNRRTREISNLLKGLSLMNISLQTITPNVLNNINRVHIPLDVVSENLEYARKNGIATGTELIFGLPGESLDSMKKVIDLVIQLRFDSVSLGVLWLLRGSEIATPKARERYKYKGRFMLGENAITNVNGLVSVECDEIAVTSDSYSFDDFTYFIQYCIIFEFVFALGYARELLFHALLFNINPSDFFRELIDNPQKYPVIGRMSLQYREKYMEHLYHTEDDVFDFVKQNLNKWVQNKVYVASLSKSRIRYDFFSELLFDGPIPPVFNEFADAIINLYKGNQNDLFKNLTSHIKDLTVKLIINPKAFEEEVTFTSPYNIKEWIMEGYPKPLSDYRLIESKKFRLKSRNPTLIKVLINKSVEEKSDNYFNFFRYTNSSDKRRIVL